MGFLRRLIGRGDTEPDTGEPPASPEPPMTEEERDRALLRAEAERLDELQQRQLRYSEYSWRPDRQGGSRRADDEEGEDTGEKPG